MRCGAGTAPWGVCKQTPYLVMFLTFVGIVPPLSRFVCICTEGQKIRILSNTRLCIPLLLTLLHSHLHPGLVAVLTQAPVPTQAAKPSDTEPWRSAARLIAVLLLLLLLLPLLPRPLPPPPPPLLLLLQLVPLMPPVVAISLFLRLGLLTVRSATGSSGAGLRSLRVLIAANTVFFSSSMRKWVGAW